MTDSAAHKEKMWCAYLDGELSAAETAAFEQSLSAQEREQLAADLQLESGMVALLSDGMSCPAAVWEKTLAQLDSRRPVSLKTIARKWLVRGSAMAAGFALVLAVAMPQGLGNDEVARARTLNTIPSNQMASLLPAFLAFDVVDVEALREQAQVNGDEASVNSFMNEHGFTLSVSTSDQRGHHAPALVGAREIPFEKEPVLELFYSCCGQPMKLVVAKQGGVAAEALSSAVATGAAQSSRRVGNYVVAVVGRHRLDSLAETIHS